MLPPATYSSDAWRVPNVLRHFACPVLYLIGGVNGGWRNGDGDGGGGGDGKAGGNVSGRRRRFLRSQAIWLVAGDGDGAWRNA
jgi:hypothetical protein